MTWAIRFYETGGPDVLTWEEVALAPPGAGEVRLRNTAIGVNMKDVGERRGDYPPPPLPAIPGIEAAAVVEAVGEGVEGVRPGDRVAYATLPAGSYCRERNLPAERLVPLPDDISDEQAAAVLLKGLTARFLLRKTYVVKPGDRILVHAAAGGVGLLLCQWAKHLGASIIGTVSSDEKAAIARAHGCDYPINYSREDFVQRVHEITGGEGLPVVYDSVGKETFEKSLACLDPLGLMVLYGVSSGLPAPLEMMKLDIWKAYYFTRPSVFVHTRRRADLLAGAEDLFAVLRSGAVKAAIGGRFALEDAAEAHRALESRATTGSLILIP